MNLAENPYQPPDKPEQIRVPKAINWRLFWLLNIGLVGALVTLILAAFLWSRFEQAQVEQQLGGRYATYDHEYEVHVYPINGLIILALVFAVPNLVLSDNLRGEPDGGHKECNDRNKKQYEKPKRPCVRRGSRLLITDFTSTPN